MSDHKLHIDLIDHYAKHKSKCQFTKVGAVAINENGKLVCSGVNGTISGFKNCNEIHMAREDHLEFSDENEIHAEMNLILELAVSTTTFKELTLYTTLSPCKNCLKHILGLNRSDKKIKAIIFKERYHRTTDSEFAKMKDKCKTAGTLLLSLDDAIRIENINVKK